MDTADLKHQTLTITLPIPFIGEVHSALCESDLHDVIGYLYFEQKFPPELKDSLRVLGYDPEQFKIYK